MNKRVEIGLGSAAHSIPVVQVEGNPLKPGSTADVLIVTGFSLPVD